MPVQPYLMFDGKCEEAIGFYKKALGAKVEMLLRFKDSPDQSMVTPGTGDKVMHANVTIADSTILMSDGHCTGKASFQGFSLSLTLTSTSDAERFFVALSEGGTIRMPLSKTFFSPLFGMLVDQFGVAWMVYVQA